MAVSLKTIEIVGCGPGAAEYLTGAARKAVLGADLLAGSRRLVELFPDYRGEKLVVDAHLEPLVDRLEAAWRAGRKVAVLVSGDPGLYSLAERLLRRFGRENCRVTPAVSSVQAAFARLGLSWDNVRVISAHGRLPPGDVDLSQWDKLAVLGGTPEAMRWAASACQLLRETHAAYLCENLTLPGERVCRVTPEDLRTLGACPETSCGAGVPPAQAAGTAPQAAGTAAPQGRGVDLGQALSASSLAIVVLVRRETL